MNGADSFDFHHRFAPSVLATCMGAAGVINAVEELYEHEQQLSVRFLCFWFNSFSAAVSNAVKVCRICHPNLHRR